MTMRIHTNAHNPLKGRLRRMLFAGILAGALGGALFGPQNTSASISICRGDPVVLLSNGTWVQLGTSIGTSASDVSKVVYALNAPAGTSVKQIFYTGGALAGKESVQFTATDTPRTYDASVLVSAGGEAATVWAEAVVPGVGFGTATGQAGQPVNVHIGS